MGIIRNINNKIMKKLVYASLSFAPVLAFAQIPNTTGLQAILNFIRTTVATLIPIVFGLAIVFFFWGLVTFLRAAGDPKAQEAGRNQMIWGVIAIAVMISIYGLVAWLQSVFGVSAITTGTVPTVTGL